MALTVTTSPVGGLLYGGSNTLQGSTPNLQSPGVQATSPSQNVTAPKNTLPASQTAAPAINDLSGSYANVNGTIYNKSTGQGYSTPQQFYSAAGVNSFNNLKFDTSWTPPTVLNGNLQAPGSSTGVLPALASSNTNTPTPTPTPAAPATTLPALASANTSNSLYTAPNQGTTGVSQGGLIGNLNTNAQTNPDYEAALAQYNAITQKIADLQTKQGTSNVNASEDSGDMSLALGRQGQINQTYGALESPLATQQAAAAAAMQSALGLQANATSGYSAAASANAPITGVQPGTVTIQPSQTNGATTSGAQSLNSLIRTRMGSDGKTTEYYDTQTGQGFSTPQQLADFVNQEQPGANTTGSNVFQYLQANGNGSSNIAGGNSSLNPLSNVGSVAQQVVNGTLGYSDALAAGGSVANYANVLQQAITAIQPGFNFNTAQGTAAAQQGNANTQSTQIATYQSAQQQGQNLSSQLNNLLSTYKINPNDLNIANELLQTVGGQTSNAQYQQFLNYINDIASTYANILTPAGATVTDYTKQLAASMINPSSSSGSIQQQIAALDQQANAKIAGTATTPNTSTVPNSGNNGVGDNGTSLYNF
jgi:hypothetical protein